MLLVAVMVVIPFVAKGAESAVLSVYVDGKYGLDGLYVVRTSVPADWDAAMVAK